MNIAEQLQKSELKTEILRIALNLKDDERYTKQDAVVDLLQVIEQHNL